MSNAKDEFLEHVEGQNVTCALIKYERNYGEFTTFVLKNGYTQNDYDLFLQSLNFVYDDGYGGQELNGYIWYDDGTWSDRGEYDGSEWWEYQEVPQIPDECK